MATTTILNDLIDLNQTGNTTALKGCVGTNAQQPADPTISVQYLVVGGGGGGGSNGTASGDGLGGGGAGGFSTGTIAIPNNTDVNIVVGEGGLGGGQTSDQSGTNGQDSGFYTIQGQGGGGGGEGSEVGSPGGSGGGGGRNSGNLTNTGVGISGQGNSGGLGGYGSSYNLSSGGGGGGASTAGAAGGNTQSSAGAGGTGSDAIALGIITYANGTTANIGEVNGATLNFSGGGGGGQASAGAANDGGLGGGGDGGTNSVGSVGTVNTGGGGGGDGSTTQGGGGTGGSGVVILKYASTATETIAGSLIGGINTSDNSSVVDFPSGTGCQALYQFENNTNDSSSNNYDPTSEANISFPTSSPAPKFGTYSLYMNGSSSYVNGIPQALATTLRTAGLFTFSMWINPITAPSSTADYIRFLDNIYVRILINSDLTLGYVVIPVAGTYIEPPLTTSVAKINLNEWSHVCLTGSVANGIKFYINGQQEAYNPAWVGTFMTYTNSDYKTNGLNGSSGLPGNANQVMDGNIDNFRVYNQELSSSQVLELVNMNTTTKFDDGTNTTLVFKGGSGTINLTDTSLPGPKVGDLRTNTDQSSANSASAMEHYMSTGWRVFNNCTTSVCNYPTTASGLFQLENNIDNTCGGGTPSQNGNITFTTSEKKFGTYSAVFSDNGKLDTAIAPGTGDWSVSLWLNPDTEGYFGGTTNGSVQYGIYMYGYTSGIIQLQNRDTGTISNLSVSGILPFGSWTHVVITHSSNLTTLYTDGSSRGTLSGNPTHSTNFIFGQSGDYAPSGDLYDGYMDQIRIFPSVLTASQITELYNETSC